MSTLPTSTSHGQSAKLVVLGYSRLLRVRFFTRKDMRRLLDGLEDAVHASESPPLWDIFVRHFWELSPRVDSMNSARRPGELV